MYKSDQTTTVAIKPCRSCGAGLIEESRFCRVCGASQSHVLPSSSPTIVSVGCSWSEPLQQYATAYLSQQKLYHPVSGPLVNAVSTGVPASVSGSRRGPLSKRMLLALMAIPIWLMIILLSPLDAYASAKIIGNRI